MILPIIVINYVHNVYGILKHKGTWLYYKTIFELKICKYRK